MFVEKARVKWKKKKKYDSKTTYGSTVYMTEMRSRKERGERNRSPAGFPSQREDSGNKGRPPAGFPAFAGPGPWVKKEMC